MTINNNENGTRTEEEKKKLLESAEGIMEIWESQQSQFYKDRQQIQQEILERLNMACKAGITVDAEFKAKVLNDIREKHKF